MLTLCLTEISNLGSQVCIRFARSFSQLLSTSIQQKRDETKGNWVRVGFPDNMKSNIRSIARIETFIDVRHGRNIHSLNV